jgi:nicotinate-nucleotide adenylyltransferase
MTEIALFGTSADPPTAGHRVILEWLSEHFDRVAVWASDNPFKNHQTSLEHRAMMLALLIRDIDSPQKNICLRQDLSDRRSLFSVEKARQVWGEDAEYTLVIGSDLAGQIRRWYRAGELPDRTRGSTTVGKPRRDLCDRRYRCASCVFYRLPGKGG